jgi:cytochrome c oxidase subunit IV
VAHSTEHTDPHSHGHAAHGEHGHGEGHGHGHGTSHVLPMKVLLGTWGTLMVMTVLTVAVAKLPIFDFGASINLLIAMVIATFKATLVCLYFMHLRYDKLFHTVVFISAILLATLFVSFALMDSTQYQTDVTWAPDDLSPAPY